jgi:hypothetical protein
MFQIDGADGSTKEPTPNGFDVFKAFGILKLRK